MPLPTNCRSIPAGNVKTVSIHAALIVIAGLLMSCTAAESPLPEADTPSGVVYAQVCGQCHKPPNPKLKIYQQWEKTIPIMKERMRVNKKQIPTQQEEGLIMAYLKRNSRG